MDSPPGKPPRLSEVFTPSPLFFVTFNTLYRIKVLANAKVHEAFIQYVSRAHEFGITVGRYVIMPDHIHLFVGGGTTLKLGNWIKGLKRALSKAITQENPWQPSFFDHLLRRDESYEEKWEYVGRNPVRAGLVARAEDWPFQGEITIIDQV